MERKLRMKNSRFLQSRLQTPKCMLYITKQEFNNQSKMVNQRHTCFIPVKNGCALFKKMKFDSPKANADEIFWKKLSCPRIVFFLQNLLNLFSIYRTCRKSIEQLTIASQRRGKRTKPSTTCIIKRNAPRKNTRAGQLK